MPYNVLGEDLNSKRPLVSRRKGDERSQTVQHLLEKCRNPREYAQFALETNDRLDNRRSAQKESIHI